MRKFTIILLALALAAGTACAQELARLLPADTVLALGTQGLSANQDKLQGFIDQYQALGVGEALGALAQEGEDELPQEDDLSPALKAALEDLEGLTAFDLLGQEAYVALSVSAVDPLPSALLLSRLSDEASARFDQIIAALAADPSVKLQELQESGTTFYVMPVEDADSPVQAVAFAKAGDLLAAASKPDALRGVLRRLAGSSEPNFAGSEGYQQVFGRLGDGNMSYYFDYAQIAQAAEPFAQGLGFDPLVKRLVAAFKTAGKVGGVVRLTDAGYESERFQAVDPEGGDQALYELLTAEGQADRSTTAFVPEGALSYSAATVDLNGWWRYLNDLSTAVPQLGSDLNSLVLSFAGVDLQTTLFDWAGSHVSSVTVSSPEPTEPGMPAQNLLGDFVYMVEATDEEAARSGLQTLFTNVAGQLAAMSSATGGAQQGLLDTDEVAGVTVNSYEISPGLQLSYAVTDGYALLATSDGAMRAALEARAGGADGPAASSVAGLPEGADSVSYTDSRAALESTAHQLSSQIQLMAGLSGASNLDFDAVSRASGAVEEFLLYVAGRAGNSLGYGTRSAEGIYGHSATEVDW